MPSNLEQLHQDVLNALETVKDPEIDSVSVGDLGMIEDVSIVDNKAFIKVLPTFMGCPALEIIQQNIEKAVGNVEGIDETTVEFIHHPPWTSDRVSKEGRERLKEFGIAPPPEKWNPDGKYEIECPYCTSLYTTVDNIFGPTACRSILYCKSCKNPFEAMKPVFTDM
ncbi:phenylacetate-CoA oxygenase subunit PaaJ [Lottiidibacillus patelloidae]|uniref:Phenylacetate-CoA oxygenase subunit PaaJ n=1 Tax=Lottiidibacillus patelloidae TaxID=2670334 RepID=A0A263BWT9_9BACI|nr:1,2-phenylacetyl-CoA epoxidase subunit PaaD [Lottiidibacillus patelloidae]OZM58174.1 phenylacetate-CoA oxygenase subunit PaaJ [Lottiidibacillus patelloidae]